MCVKDFKGFTCGHCSYPTLHPCPMASQGPFVQVCKYVAERPEFINNYCAGCMRVVWNQWVLANEGQHRDLHVQGMCSCGFDFTVAERERSAAVRREMQKGKEIPQGQGWGSGTKNQTHQPMNSLQETYRQGDDRKKGSHQRISPSHTTLDYQSRGRTNGHQPVYRDPNFRQFVASGPYIRYHLQGEQYKSTLREDGTFTCEINIPTPERQHAESDVFSNNAPGGEAGFTDKSSAKGLAVPELSAGYQFPAVSEDIHLNKISIPTPPILISKATEFPTRPRSSSI